MGRDLHPVLGADKAPSPEIIGGGVVGRARGAVDRAQDVDRGGDAGPRGHANALPFSHSDRRPGESRDPPSRARAVGEWVPAFAGTTVEGVRGIGVAWLAMTAELFGIITCPGGSWAPRG